MIERMKEVLEEKKSQLKYRQYAFRLEVERNLSMDTFEPSAIAELLLMAKLKAEIRQLEYCLQFKG